MQQQETSSKQATSGNGLVKELKDQVSEQAHDLADQAQETAESGKQRLAEGAIGVAQALRHASEGLRSDEQEVVSDYTQALAGKVEEVARFLQSRDLPTMAREVSGFARRQPALFLGGAFTLGIVAARFLKSSGGPQRAGTSATDFGPAPRDYTSALPEFRGAEENSPDPSVTTPGGVPPLPSARGGGL